jgi:transcriptional regulator with XRE-family HTH domain
VDLKEIGKTVVRLREARSLNQVEFAAKAGVSRGSLQELEKGRGNPTLESLMSIATFCGLTLNELLGDGAAKVRVAEAMANQAVPPPSPPIDLVTARLDRMERRLELADRLERENAELRAEVERLRAELNEVPETVRQGWKDTKEPLVRALSFLVLTGDTKYFDRLKPDAKKKVQPIFDALQKAGVHSSD